MHLLNPSIGFLSDITYLTHSTEIKAWENVAQTLPKILSKSQLHSEIHHLPEFPFHQLSTPTDFERGMQLFAFLGQAYIWEKATPHTTLPAKIAKPWCQIAQQLGVPPILSYHSYVLANWRKINPQGALELGNIALLQYFHHSVDEEWFVAVHVEIEAKAVPALLALSAAQEAMQAQQPQDLIPHLKQIASTLQSICQTLKRMPEHCDPTVYFTQIRPYLRGWKDNPSLPQGIIYEDCYENKPQLLRGATGAQTAIIQALDIVLGITHHQDSLDIYLREMRDYMLPSHRLYLKQLENNHAIREFILKHYHDYPDLREFYNECIQLIVEFRKLHLQYAALYVQKQSKESSTGTGGTPFMVYLRKHKMETLEDLIL